MTPFLPFGTKKRTHFTFNCFYLLYNSFLFFYHLPSNKNINDNLIYKYITSPDTVFDIAQSSTKSERYFAVNSWLPSDLPEQSEFFIDIMVDKATARKNVIAWSYPSFRMYKRQMFNGKWLTDWKSNIISNDISWKTLGYYEQGVEVSLPSTFNELLVIIYINGWAFNLPINYVTLTDSYRGYLGCSAWNSSDYYGYHVSCSKTKIILSNSNHTGAAPDTKAMAVYYR